MQGLTQRQQMVLDFIRQSIADRGYPPTLREIGAHMGIRSTNGTNDHLRALERKGYIQRDTLRARGVVVIDGVTEPVLPGPHEWREENKRLRLLLDRAKSVLSRVPATGEVVILRGDIYDGLARRSAG